jgi:hypothetical protein
MSLTAEPSPTVLNMLLFLPSLKPDLERSPGPALCRACRVPKPSCLLVLVELFGWSAIGAEPCKRFQAMVVKFFLCGFLESF